MSVMSELHAAGQQIDRLTDVVPPPPFAVTAPAGHAPVKSWTAESAIEQVQKCTFECEGGPLDNNDAWRWIVHALKRVPALEADLNECREFIENYVDVNDGDYGEPMPNRAMALVSMIDQSLSGAKT